MTSGALALPNGEIGNDPNNQPPPQIQSDENGESSPNGAGSGRYPPAQGLLDDSCFSGGVKRQDGTTSAGVWLNECGTLEERDLFKEFAVEPGSGFDPSVPSAGDRSYITYVFTNQNGEVTYVGRASGAGTPEQVLAGRLARGHDHYRTDLTPSVIAVQGSYAANRGAEEFFIQAYLARGSKLTNVDPAVGFSRMERGRKSVTYIDAFFRDLMEGRG